MSVVSGANDNTVIPDESNCEMANNRIDLWDNTKGILIILVVAGHFVDVLQFTTKSLFYRGIFLFIYSFHMPLFIFVSGLFYNPKKAKHHIVYFLSLYLYLKVLFFFVRMLLGGNVRFALLTEDGLPWFMFALAVFNAIRYISGRINQRYLLFVSLVVSCFAGYDQSLGDMFVASRILVFYPFFLMGTLVSPKHVEGMFNRTHRLVSSVVILLWIFMCLFIGKLYLLRPLFTGRNAYGEEIMPYAFLIRLVCIGISTIIILAFVCLTPRKHLFIISNLGKNTLQIYCYHYVILSCLVYFGIAERIFNIGVCGRALWLLISIPVAFFCSWFSLFKYPAKWIYKVISINDFQH